MRIAVVTPTTGNSYLAKAINSVRFQTVPVDHYIFVDGREHWDKAYEITRDYPKLKVYQLPESTGKGGYNGHRIYAACSHLVNADIILLLDEDCFYGSEHAKTCEDFITRHKLSWAYSLRKVVGESDEHLCNDDCDSLGLWGNYAGAGYSFVDTNCFAFTKESMVMLGQAWHSNLYQTDVLVSKLFMEHFPNFGCTGQYTVNYRLHGKSLGKLDGWFKPGNQKAKEVFVKGFPWNTEKLNESSSVQPQAVL